MLVINHSYVISSRVTTTDLVTTLLAHILYTAAVMLLLQVVKDNEIPENNKTKHTYLIFIQAYKFSFNEQIPMQMNRMP